MKIFELEAKMFGSNADVTNLLVFKNPNMDEHVLSNSMRVRLDKLRSELKREYIADKKSYEKDSSNWNKVSYKYEKPLNICYQKNEMMVKKMAMVMRPLAKDKSKWSEGERIRALEKANDICLCTYMNISDNADSELENDLISDLIKIESEMKVKGYEFATQPKMREWERKQWINTLSLSLGETSVQVWAVSTMKCQFGIQ
jgi:hypothetical protein